MSPPLDLQPITAGANDGHDRAELGKVHVE